MISFSMLILKKIQYTATMSWEDAKELVYTHGKEKAICFRRKSL